MTHATVSKLIPCFLIHANSLAKSLFIPTGKLNYIKCTSVLNDERAIRVKMCVCMYNYLCMSGGICVHIQNTLVVLNLTVSRFVCSLGQSRSKRDTQKVHGCINYDRSPSDSLPFSLTLCARKHTHYIYT